ncbi:MAG: hypothetical protein ACI35P_04090 [Bacillus sp. (in: firmicutes)]
MKWKDIFIGAAIGFACGYATKKVIDQYSQQSPDDILHTVKEKMQEEGKIIGSWILMTPEVYLKNNLRYQVYRGGLTKIINDTQTQYEFIADAETGTIIDCFEQK